MIQVEDKFLSHSFRWVTLTLIAILVMPAFLSTNSFKLQHDELTMYADWGKSIGDITGRADAIFRSLFVDSGITGWSKALLVRHEAASQFTQLQHNVGSFTESYNNNLWMMIYRGIWRIVAIGPLYIGSMICMVIPAFVDGLAVRSKKRFDFGNHNPLYFYGATHLIALMIGLTCLVPFLPVSLSEPIFFASFVAFGAAAWVMASNFQTGL